MTSWLGKEFIKLLIQVFLGWMDQLERDQQNQQKGRTDAQTEATAEEAQLEAAADTARTAATTGSVPDDHGHWRD